MDGGLPRASGRRAGGLGPLGWLLIFLTVATALRLVYAAAGVYDLSGDEALYWEYSRHPQWCYFFKGPVVAWCIWPATALLGNTVLAVRLPAVLLSAGCSMLLYALGRRIYSPKVGAWAGFLYQLTPLFGFYNMGMTIDAPYVFLWILALLLTHVACSPRGEGILPLRAAGVSPASSSASSVSSSLVLEKRQAVAAAANEEETRGQDARGTQGRDALATWLALAVALGLGLMTKYTMALYYPCALLYLAVSPQRRRLLLRPGPWIAVLLSLAFLAPLLRWDSHHEWVNLAHNLGHTEAGKGLRITPRQFVEFAGGQLGAVTPILLVMMVIALFRRRKADPLSFWFSVPLLAFFTFKSLQGRVYTNWSMAAYPTGFIAFAAVFVEGYRSLGKHARRLAWAAVIMAAVATGGAHYPYILQLLGLPARTDPLMRELKGWHEVGEEVSRLQAEVSPRHFIIGARRMLTSDLAFYVKGNPPTYCPERDPNSPSSDYDIWPGYDGLIGYDAIFVKYETQKPATIPDWLAARFDKVEERRFVVKGFLGSPYRKYGIFLCHNYRGPPAGKHVATSEPTAVE